MLSRPSMELNDVPGNFPDYGAIFMPKPATRKECFRRNLLGLPLGQADFVMQVKAGMILFYFEVEKRQLHGVFQACSNGALDIVPHAFSSSGKKFPAQVRFKQIWNCSPLHENEFRDVIRENYYSANKFNFGLSERQVRRLMSLFSVRQIKDGPNMKEYIQNKVASPMVYSRNEGRTVVDGRSARVDKAKDERTAGSIFGSEFLDDSIGTHEREIHGDRGSSRIARNRVRDEGNAGNSFGSEFIGDSINSCYGREIDDDMRPDHIARKRVRDERNAGSSFGSEFLGDSISNHRGEIDDDRRSSRIARDRYEVEKHQFSNEHFIDQLGRSVYDQIEMGDRDIIRNEGSMNIGPRFTGMANFPGHSYTLTGRGYPDDLSYVTGYVGDHCSEDNRFHPPNLGENDGNFQPDSPLYSVKPVMEANSLIHDQSRQSPSLHNYMDPQSSSLSFAALCGDTEPGAGIMASYPGYSLEKDRRGHPDASFQNELRSDCKEDICFQPREDPGLVQYNPSVYSINATLEASSFVNDLHYQLSRPSFESQNVDSSLTKSLVAGMPIPRGFSASYGDAVVTRPFNYDQDVQSLKNRQSSPTSGISNSGHESTRPFNNIFLSRGGRFFASHGEPKGTSRHQYIDDAFSADIRLSYPNHNDDSIKKSARSRGLSPVDFTRIFSENEMIDVDAASRSFGLDKDSSPMMDYRYPLSSQLEEHSLLSSSKNPDICKSSRTIYSRDEKRRVSVFSRIAMPLEAHEHDEHKMVSSVDEVMDVLHESRQQWLKSKSSKQLTAKRDEVSRMRGNNPSKIAKVSKNQLPQICKQKDQLPQICKNKDQLPQISMELTDEGILAGEANDASKGKEVTFRDFKRRTKVTNFHSGEHDVSAMIIGSPGWQHRKRKLVRPKFNEGEPCDDHMMKNKDSNTTDQDKSVRVTGSPGAGQDKNDLVTGSPGRYNKMRRLIRPKFCEIKSPSDVVFECKISEYNVSQLGMESDSVQHDGNEERNPGTEIGSKCKEENIMGGSVFATNAGKERKEYLENVCNQSGPCQNRCEDESYCESSGSFKHPEVDGLVVNQTVSSEVSCGDESNIEASVSFKHPEVDGANQTVSAEVCCGDESNVKAIVSLKHPEVDGLVVNQTVSSEVCCGDESNVEASVSLKHPEVDGLVVNQTVSSEVCCGDESNVEASVSLKHPEVDGLVVNQTVSSEVCCGDESNVEASVSLKHPEVDGLVVNQTVSSEVCCGDESNVEASVSLKHPEVDGLVVNQTVSSEVCCGDESNVEASVSLKHPEVDGLPVPVRFRNSKLLVLQAIFGESCSSERAETEMVDCELGNCESLLVER